METGIPLHPAIVHLPLGLAIALPFITAAIYYLIKTDKLDSLAWWIPVVLQVVVVIFTFTAMQIGEGDEEKVEKVVAEEYIEEHEEAGKIFLILGIASLLVLGAGIKSSKFQSALQAGSIALLLVSLGGGVYAGKLGGELVYKHGAASAFTNPDGAGVQPAAEEGKENKEQEDDDDD